LTTDLKCDRKVWGPAGTGKTFTSAEIASQETDDGKNVCAVTYRRDLANQLVPELETHGVNEGSYPWVSTIHGVARRLTNYPLQKCLPSISPSPKDYAREFFRKWGPKYAGTGGLPDTEKDTVKFGDKLLKARSWKIHSLKDSVKEHPDIKINGIDPSLFEEFEEAYREFKQEKGLWDFEDVLLDALISDRAPPTDVLIVDEAQDNSPLMHQLVARWSLEADLSIVAGDPNQSIYGYQGGSPDLFWSHTDGEPIHLGTNHRVPADTWGLAHSILDDTGHRTPELDFKNSEGQLHRIQWNDFDTLTKNISPTIETFYLVRCRFQIGDIADRLTSTGIPFKSVDNKGWKQRDQDLYNAVVKARKATNPGSHLLTADANPDAPSLTESEAEILLRALPANLMRITKKRWLDNPEPLSPKSLSSKLTQMGTKQLHSDTPLDNTVSNGVTEARKKRLQNALMRHGDLLKNISHEITTIHGSKGRTASNVVAFNGVTPKIASEVEGEDQPEEARVWHVATTRHTDNLYILDKPGIQKSPFM